jgi:hypothetical protein
MPNVEIIAAEVKVVSVKHLTKDVKISAQSCKKAIIDPGNAKLAR